MLFLIMSSSLKTSDVQKQCSTDEIKITSEWKKIMPDTAVLHKYLVRTC